MGIVWRDICFYTTLRMTECNSWVVVSLFSGSRKEITGGVRGTYFRVHG